MNRHGRNTRAKRGNAPPPPFPDLGKDPLREAKKVKLAQGEGVQPAAGVQPVVGAQPAAESQVAIRPQQGARSRRAAQARPGLSRFKEVHSSWAMERPSVRNKIQANKYLSDIWQQLSDEQKSIYYNPNIDFSTREERPLRPITQPSETFLIETDAPPVANEDVFVVNEYIPKGGQNEVQLRENKKQLLDKFLGRNVQLEGHEWRGITLLGGGSYGSAGLWYRTDIHGNILDRLAVKEADYSPRKGEIPSEITIHEALQSNCSYIVRYRGSRLFRENEMYRLYLGYCPHGSLHQFGHMIGTIWEYTSTPKAIPEQYLWYLFKALAEAGKFLERGTLDQIDDWQWPQILHLDIKPDNIFLAPPDPNSNFPQYPKPVLGDFGMSRLTYDEDPANPLQFRGLGTPAYFAPEQFRLDPPYANPVKLGSHTNVYAVAATMWFLIEADDDGGRYTSPFVYRRDNEGKRQRVRLHSGNTPDDVEQLFSNTEHNENYTDELKDLVKKCLRFDPQSRPTFEEILEEIDRNLHGLVREPEVFFGGDIWKIGQNENDVNHLEEIIALVKKNVIEAYQKHEQTFQAHHGDDFERAALYAMRDPLPYLGLKYHIATRPSGGPRGSPNGNNPSSGGHSSNRPNSSGSINSDMSNRNISNSTMPNSDALNSHGHSNNLMSDNAMDSDE